MTPRTEVDWIDLDDDNAPSVGNLLTIVGGQARIIKHLISDPKGQQAVDALELPPVMRGQVGRQVPVMPTVIAAEQHPISAGDTARDAHGDLAEALALELLLELRVVRAEGVEQERVLQDHRRLRGEDRVG